MTGLYIPGVSAPAEIRAQLDSLSKNVEFLKEDTKAANGYVYFGVNRVTRANITVKFYYWGGEQAYHAEPQQLATVRSPNVLQILDAGLLNNEWAYFVTPTCIHGDLDFLLESTRIGNFAAVDCTSEVLSGLSHLHAQRYLHRDLKPANVYLSDQGVAVIGDFGSVKKLPEGRDAIPPSRHSILYRPPESFNQGFYGFTGDIYQTGIILYQLLGGYLSYDLIAYLSTKQRIQLAMIEHPADQSIYIDTCLKETICAGRLLNLDTMPPWVPNDLRKAIKKACHLDPARRFQTPAAFMAKLHELRANLLDWRVDDGNPTLNGKVSYRVMSEGEESFVQKRKTGQWRNDNSFAKASFEQLVVAVSDLVRGA